MEKIIPALKHLNTKFFNSKFCPQWVIQNKQNFGDLVDIKTQCYVTAYAIAYLLTGSAIDGWYPTTYLDVELPILLNIDEDEHMVIYYQRCLYESFHQIYRLKIKEDIELYKIKYDPYNFLNENYKQHGYGDFENIVFYQKNVDPSSITIDNVIQRYEDL